MHKVAVVVFSSLEGSGKSAVYRSLMFVEELLLSGDDVVLLFDGGGSKSLALMLDPDHDLHRVWTKAAPALLGACSFCARAYGVKDALEAARIPLLADDKGHASLRALLDQGRQIVTV